MHIQETESRWRHRAKSAVLVLLCATTLGSSACTTTLPIYSRPEGAEVVMDEKRALGQTPIVVKEQAWVWTSHTFTFTKEGYRPETIKVRARPKIPNVAFCLLGFCISWIVWPVGFSGEYKREIVVNLEREFDADAFDAIDVSDSRSPLLEDGPILSFE
jgi:hypothetical protein